MKPYLILAILGVLLTFATLWDGFAVVQLEKGRLVWAWWLLVPMSCGCLILLFAHLLSTPKGAWVLLGVASVSIIAVLTGLWVAYQLADTAALVRRVMALLYNLSAILLIWNTKSTG